MTKFDWQVEQNRPHWTLALLSMSHFL